jgi:hypothetical protein
MLERLLRSGTCLQASSGEIMRKVSRAHDSNRSTLGNSTLRALFGNPVLGPATSSADEVTSGGSRDDINAYTSNSHLYASYLRLNTTAAPHLFCTSTSTPPSLLCRVHSCPQHLITSTVPVLAIVHLTPLRQTLLRRNNASTLAMTHRALAFTQHTSQTCL